MAEMSPVVSAEYESYQQVQRQARMGLAAGTIAFQGALNLNVHESAEFAPPTVQGVIAQPDIQAHVHDAYPKPLPERLAADPSAHTWKQQQALGRLAIPPANPSQYNILSRTTPLPPEHTWAGLFEAAVQHNAGTPHVLYY